MRRLWEVCRLPDYRKIAPAQHAELVGQIFSFIADGGVVPEDWIAGQIRSANIAEGDIDTLSARIAQIRTWTFVANQPDWLAEPATWREETKAVEDALSDALHERLIKRFVDRRTSVLMRRLRENTMLEAEITPAGDVMVEGHHVGMLQGFRFTPDPQAEGAEAQALRGAAQKALATAIAERAERLSPRRRPRHRALARRLSALAGRAGRAARRRRRRLEAAPRHPRRRAAFRPAARAGGGAPRSPGSPTTSATLLKPLIDLSADQAITGMARGIAFQLVENLGILERRAVLEEVRGLSQDERAGLRRHGVRFGAYHIYIPVLLKPAPSTLAALLWALKHQDLDVPGLAELPAISGSGRTSVAVDPALDPDIYRRFGFRIYGNRAVRIDILERLADLIRPALAWRPSATGERPAGALRRRTRLHRDAGDDLAARRVRRGFLRHPARPRLSHGAAAEAGRAGAAADRRREREAPPMPRPARRAADAPTPQRGAAAPKRARAGARPPAEALRARRADRREPPAEEPPSRRAASSEPPSEAAGSRSRRSRRRDEEPPVEEPARRRRRRRRLAEPARTPAERRRQPARRRPSRR